MRTLLKLTGAGTVILAGYFSLALHAQTPAYDLLLTHARIVDGTGAAWFRGDVALLGSPPRHVG